MKKEEIIQTLKTVLGKKAENIKFEKLTKTELENLHDAIEQLVEQIKQSKKEKIKKAVADIVGEWLESDRPIPTLLRKVME